MDTTSGNHIRVSHHLCSVPNNCYILGDIVG